MEQVTRALRVQAGDAVATVREFLWQLMDRDIVQGLLVPMQTHPREAPAPTLIKSWERLQRANPFAPVMTMNSAKIVGLLLAQDSGKRLAAVLRPCEARALDELARQGPVSLSDLLTVSVDCLGSHGEGDYEQRAALWGDEMPTRESLRWSRRGQIAPYRFRPACQICERPSHDQADVVVGLFGQKIDEKILILVEKGLAHQLGINENGWTQATSPVDLVKRRKTIEELTEQRHNVRQRFLDSIEERTRELSALLSLFSSCTLCGECQEACPLTTKADFDFGLYEEATPEYVAARLLDIVRRAESCVGCGMCEAACHQGLPLTLLTQMVAQRDQARREIIASFTHHAAHASSFSAPQRN